MSDRIKCFCDKRIPGFAGEIGSVWAIAWPLILTNLLNVMVGIVDFKMVGTLGITSIAAVGMARQVMMFLMVLMIAVSGGGSVLVAHAYGTGDADRVSTVAAKVLGLMTVGALLLVTPAGLLCSEPLLRVLGAADDVVQAGGAYLQILFLGCVCTMLNFGVTGILLGVGKTKVSLVLLISVNLLNVVLNYVFIFGMGPVPALGVTGAAVGTVIARAAGSVVGLWIVTSPRLPIRATWRRAWEFDPRLVMQILYLGGPRSLQGIVRNSSRLLTLRIITLLPNSTQAISAYSVAMQVRMTTTFIGLAFMSAAMARVGQNLGAGDPEKAGKSGWISACIAAAMMTVVAFVFLLVPGAIMGFFTDNRNVIAMGRKFFVVIALAEPVMAFAFALGGALRGGGDPVAPFIYSSVSDLLVVVLVGYLLAIPLGMGFTGIAVAMAISAVTRAVPTTIKYHQGSWKKTRL